MATTPIALPYNPGGFEIDGALPSLAALMQVDNILAQNGAPAMGNFSFNTDTSSVLSSNAYTMTAAKAVNSLYTITGSNGAGFTATTPTAAQVAAVWPGLQVNATAILLYVNLIGTQTATVAGGTNVTVTAGSASSPATVVTGAARLFLWQCTAAPSSIISMTWANGIATVTTATPHGFAAGNSITISNTTNAAVNAAWTVSTIVNSYQFTFAITQAQFQASAGSPAAINLVFPSPSSLQPATVNLTTNGTTFNLVSCFSWPATLIA